MNKREEAMKGERNGWGGGKDSETGRGKNCRRAEGEVEKMKSEEVETGIADSSGSCGLIGWGRQTALACVIILNHSLVICLRSWHCFHFGKESLSPDIWPQNPVSTGSRSQQ